MLDNWKCGVGTKPKGFSGAWQRAEPLGGLGGGVGREKLEAVGLGNLLDLSRQKPR